MGVEVVSSARPILRALRPHQWAKNALLLVPLLAAHHVADTVAFGVVLQSVVAFSLCASSMYVINDRLESRPIVSTPVNRCAPLPVGSFPL